LPPAAPNDRIFPPGQAGRAGGDEYRNVDVGGSTPGRRGSRPERPPRRAGSGPDQPGPRRPDSGLAGSGRPAAGHPDAGPAGNTGRGGLEAVLAEVAKGDHAAFTVIYDQAGPAVLGTVLRVVRDPAQSEEVMQEVLLEVWRTAARFDPSAGSATAWIMTLAHRRAVDRVRSEQRATEREFRAATATIAYDEVSDAVEARLERERVRRCLAGLTALQRESVLLAYYGGHSYREVAQLLGVAVGTVKTRMRDGLIRLRDCLGVD
jgi:RNA polymerase sigma-70 factor, ECF subfamily